MMMAPSQISHESRSDCHALIEYGYNLLMTGIEAAFLVLISLVPSAGHVW